MAAEWLRQREEVRKKQLQEGAGVNARPRQPN
jgi:hypothetical protein